LPASATQKDVEFSNASVHKLALDDDAMPGSSEGTTAAVGSVEPKENTPPKPASADESVPYSTVPKIARQRASFQPGPPDDAAIVVCVPPEPIR